MTSDSILIMRFPSDVKEALRMAAQAERRSMTNLTLVVLSDWLAERGYMARPGKRVRGQGRK
jgi:hypothetical protein